MTTLKSMVSSDPRPLNAWYSGSNTKFRSDCTMHAVVKARTSPDNSCDSVFFFVIYLEKNIAARFEYLNLYCLSCDNSLYVSSCVRCKIITRTVENMNLSVKIHWQLCSPGYQKHTVSSGLSPAPDCAWAKVNEDI